MQMKMSAFGHMSRNIQGSTLIDAVFVHQEASAHITGVFAGNGFARSVAEEIRVISFMLSDGNQDGIREHFCLAGASSRRLVPGDFALVVQQFLTLLLICCRVL